MKKIIPIAMSTALLLGAVTGVEVKASTLSDSAKQTADYLMTQKDNGVPNWFDPAYYSGSYPDLEAAFGTDAAALYRHCMTYGLAEGRLVSSVLDVVKYRAAYADLEAAFGDDWSAYIRHYFAYGIMEGRENYTSFDVKAYLNRYADLKEAFGEDLSKAAMHYLLFGSAEGRDGSAVKIQQTVKEERTPLDGAIVVRGSHDAYTVYIYDNDRLAAKEEYNSYGWLENEYEYDAYGNEVRNVTYDAYGNSNETRTTYDYNRKRKPVKAYSVFSDGSSQIVEYQYEHGSSGRKTGEKAYIYFPDGSMYSTEEWEIDGNGRFVRGVITYANYDTKIVEYSYDAKWGGNKQYAHNLPGRHLFFI